MIFSHNLFEVILIAAITRKKCLCHALRSHAYTREAMEQSLGVTHLSLTVDENDITGGALKVLEIIRPTWPKECIKFKLLTDGITNKLVGCNLIDSDARETVLVRVYGNKTDLLIDRKAETRNILLLNSAGLAPQLYATFQNGLAYEFVPGNTLTDKTVSQPEIYRLVASHMAHMHQVKVADQPHQPVLWNKLQNFLDLVPERFTDSCKHRRYEEVIVPKQKIQEEINLLREKLSKLNSPIVFAHNDLLLGNVVHTSENNTVTFIDFEYSALNYQAYDIGNHFAEFVGLENVDYSKYPGKELQWNWLRVYLSVLQGDDNISDRDIQKLYVQVNQFSLVAHIFWGVWALIQAEHSYINFDFMEYAAIRFNEYFAKKDAFLALDLPR